MQTLPWLFCGWGLDKTIRKLLSKAADLIKDKCKFKQQQQKRTNKLLLSWRK